MLARIANYLKILFKSKNLTYQHLPFIHKKIIKRRTLYCIFKCTRFCSSQGPVFSNRNNRINIAPTHWIMGLIQNPLKLMERDPLRKNKLLITQCQQTRLQVYCHKKWELQLSNFIQCDRFQKQLNYRKEVSILFNRQVLSEIYGRCHKLSHLLPCSELKEGSNFFNMLGLSVLLWNSTKKSR